MAKHLIYEVTETDVQPSADRQAFSILIDSESTNLALRVNRRTLAHLKVQIEVALADPAPRAGQH
jgi:hypothetical protein